MMTTIRRKTEKKVGEEHKTKQNGRKKGDILWLLITMVILSGENMYTNVGEFKWV